MLKIIRTDSNNGDFKELVRLLDKYLAVTDGEEHGFYAQYNKLDHIKHVVMAYENGEAVSCGAIKEFTNSIVEIKRMYTKPEWRGKGIAGEVLAELEKWGKEMGYQTCVLETGKRQPEAIALYKKQGYSLIDNYGQYEGVENSLCFGKTLS